MKSDKRRYFCVHGNPVKRGLLWHAFICFFLIILFSGTISQAAQKKTDKDKVIGRGEGIVVTKGELQFFKDNYVPPNVVPTQDALLKVFLRQKLFSLEAEKRGIDKRPDVRLRLQMERERTLGRIVGEEYLKEHLNITDEVLRSYYLSHIQEFQTPRRLDIYRIVLKDKALMNKVIEKARSKPDSFPELATEYSVDPMTQPRSGHMGLIREDKLIPELKAAFKGAKKGSIVGPVELKGFQYLFWVKAIRPLETKPFDSVKDLLYKKVERKKSSEALDEFLKTLEKEYKFQWVEK